MLSTKHEDDIEFLAPENFAMVEAGVYRSAFPRTKNLPFMKQLNLKSVVSLVPEDYPTAMAEFYSATGIQLLCHGLDGNKWPFKEIDQDCLQAVLHDVLNPANRPLLIHCNKGKHRTGSVVGSLRKIRGWALSVIFNEYILYAAPKTRLEDQQLIEAFQFRHQQLQLLQSLPHQLSEPKTSNDSSDSIRISEEMSRVPGVTDANATTTGDNNVE